MRKCAKLISEIRGGLPASQIDQQIEQAVAAAAASGKKATVTITMVIEPHGRDNREMHISLKSSMKAPSAPDLEEPSIYYRSERGNELLRNDPLEQRTIFEGKADGGSPAEGRTGTGG